MIDEFRHSVSDHSHVATLHYHPNPNLRKRGVQARPINDCNVFNYLNKYNNPLDPRARIYSTNHKSALKHSMKNVHINLAAEGFTLGISTATAQLRSFVSLSPVKSMRWWHIAFKKPQQLWPYPCRTRASWSLLNYQWQGEGSVCWRRWY